MCEESRVGVHAQYNNNYYPRMNTEGYGPMIQCYVYSNMHIVVRFYQCGNIRGSVVAKYSTLIIERLTSFLN